MVASLIDNARHRHWLEAEGQRLLDFAKTSRLVGGGFGMIDVDGRVPSGTRADTILTARAVHAYALAEMLGIVGSGPLVDHGLGALQTLLEDEEHEGWYAGDPAGPSGAGRKQAYVHAFVALGASTAFLAGRPGAENLLDRATDVIETRFWSDEEGAMRESFALDWSDEEDYRGANSNMHSVEAFLAIADALDAPLWRKRALRIVERLIHGTAKAHGYVIPEHFDRHWTPLPDYNRDRPDDMFRPFGTTPGHSLEWAHLMLKLEASLVHNGEEAPSWLCEDAAALFEAAVAKGWAPDDKPGLAYTLDWNGEPSIANRAHWTLAEGVTAAAALSVRTGEPAYAEWYRRFWDYIDLTLIDRQRGSWWHEVDADGAPSSRVYGGKPDLYHAYQATLTPRLPLTMSMAKAVRQGLPAD